GPCRGRAPPTELPPRAPIAAAPRALANERCRRPPARGSRHSATPAVASTGSGSCGRPPGGGGTPGEGSDGRYGSETVAPSPLALIVNTPVAVSDAYTYAAQPDGGFGTEARNGPATWPWPLVTWVVRAVRPAAPLGG